MVVKKWGQTTIPTEPPDQSITKLAWSPYGAALDGCAFIAGVGLLNRAAVGQACLPAVSGVLRNSGTEMAVGARGAAHLGEERLDGAG